MKSDQKRNKQLNTLPGPCPKPRAMALEAPHPPTGGGMLSYRELTYGEVVAVSGGPQVTNDEVVPPPV